MKSIFDQSTREELIARINKLNESSTPQWGKMTIFQMLKHCTRWDEWVLGTYNPRYKQDFMGFIFGKIALKSNVKDDRPIQKNMPAGKLAVKETNGDVTLQKQLWIQRIGQYENYSNPNFIHDFFGKMTKEQIGIFAYKHADHHLRQFNV
ncbi:MAG: DUF1569 domain-containing protein [Bacteroidota bacterium]